MVDPSHAVGKRSLVAPMACAALAAGADAVMIDIHPRPEDALVDGAQALVPDEMIVLGKQLQLIADAMGRPVNR
jgi:3-deoxy-7-phosphoheptulonate synthase